MFDELNYSAARNVPKKLRPKNYIIEWAIEVDMLDKMLTKLEQDVYSKIRSLRLLGFSSSEKDFNAQLEEHQLPMLSTFISPWQSVNGENWPAEDRRQFSRIESPN